MPVRPMSGVIFSALEVTDGDGRTADKSRRSDSPDSGQGGYFTQSESESRGSQSPVEAGAVGTGLQQIYKLTGSQTRLDNRRTKSTLQGYQDVVTAAARSRSQELRSPGKPLTNSSPNKVANNRSKLPARPGRVSSSLPPPVPKKQTERRTVPPARRPVPAQPPPQERKLSGKTLPLQIQSPSIVQALRATTDKRKPAVPASSSSGPLGPPAGFLKKSARNLPAGGGGGPAKTAERESGAGGERTTSRATRPVTRPSQPSHLSKDVNVNAANSKEAIKPTKPTKNFHKINRETVKTKDKGVENRSKIASESLASRARRTTEDKVKQICRNLKSSSQERKMTGEKTNLERNDSGHFPKQPVQSLIKLYDKSKVKSVHCGHAGQNNKPVNVQSTRGNSDIKPKQKHQLIPKPGRSHNCVGGAATNNKRDVNTFGQHIVKTSPGNGGAGGGGGSESSKYSSTNRTWSTQASRFKKEATTSQAKTNSIDEFLESAKRTRQKYQDMLKDDSDPDKKNDSLEVKTEPTERDLQTGCFTDVSYAGYFANPKTPENSQGANMNNISIYGNSSDLDENQNNLCKQPSVDQEAERRDGDQGDQRVTNSKNINQEFVPTPSPRNKKKQRREQILQEHKQLGNRIVTALARNHFEPEILEEAGNPGDPRDSKSDKARDMTAVELVQTAGDNHLHLKLKKLENEVRVLEQRSESLQAERERAVEELQETQLMSEEQIEKLCCLERKQDTLELENINIRQKLHCSEAEFVNLNKQFCDLQADKEMLNAKYESLLAERKTLEAMAGSYQEISSLDEKIVSLQGRVKILEHEKKSLQETLDVKQNNFYEDIEKIKVAYELETEKLEAEMKTLKSQILSISEKNDNLDVEKRHLEDKLSKLHQLDYEEIIQQLRLDLKQTKALLKDCQSERNSETGNSKIIKQLKSQLEEAESEKSASIRQRKSHELDLLDLQDQMEDILQERNSVEKKYEEANKENVLLANQLRENEEELEEILTKYKSSISALTAHQNSLQNQATIIAELENENINLTDKMETLQRKCSQMQEDSEVGNDKKSELKLKELEHKLNLEISSRERFESLSDRLKEKISQSETEAIISRKNLSVQEEFNKKLNIQIKDLKEDIVTLQIREMDVNEKKNILEKKLEIAEAETITVRSHLELANRRIEDLQLALNCDTESECSSLPYSDHSQDDLDVFLMNHRKRMAEQKEEERKIRESLLRENNNHDSEC